MLHRLVKIQGLSDEIAWELVGPLFRQRATVVVGGTMYIAFGLLGFFTSGRWLYAVGVLYALFVTLWRLQQMATFEARPATANPSDWAVKGLTSGWAMAVGWAGWSTLAATEQEPRLLAVLFGIHAAFVAGAAVVNSSVPIIGEGQVIMGALPLSVACLFAGNMYLDFYAVIVLLQISGGLALVKNLHQARLRMLSNEVQARELSAKLASANEELELVNQHLKQQVATDPLTGLLNRRAFDLAAAREWRSAMREQRSLSILMIDVDYFKAYNDHYGHQAGDLCLRNVASVLGAVLYRPSDILARYGGEEFIAILPTTEADGAGRVAARVLETLAARVLPHELSQAGRITVSIGVASAPITPSLNLTTLVEFADQALYDAKRKGRNRVEIHMTHLQPPAMLDATTHEEDLTKLLFSAGG